MKQFKRFCAATLLSLAIGITALAGDVQAPANPLPPAPIPVPTETTTAPGDASTLDTSSPTDVFAQLTLELYAQLLSMF